MHLWFLEKVWWLPYVGTVWINWICFTNLILSFINVEWFSKRCDTADEKNSLYCCYRAAELNHLQITNVDMNITSYSFHGSLFIPQSSKKWTLSLLVKLLGPLIPANNRHMATRFTFIEAWWPCCAVSFIFLSAGVELDHTLGCCQNWTSSFELQLNPWQVFTGLSKTF